MHVSVLAGPAMDWLAVHEGGTYVDCTAGAGGHATLIAGRLGTGGRLIALDRDPVAVALATETLARYPNAEVLHRNYSQLGEVLEELGIDRVDGILIDAGLSSMQLDAGDRGFSFQQDGPLDMRMDTSRGQTAAEYLASADESELARVLRTYGDVGPAKRIARAITRRSRASGLHTTGDLVEAVSEALDRVREVPEETRTVFQAIRIAVNREFKALEEALEAGISALATGGRLVAISFHSGEDRIVKNAFRNAARKTRELHPDGRIRKETPPRVKVLTPKPVVPDETERRANPRAASAKLRACERF